MTVIDQPATRPRPEIERPPVPESPVDEERVEHPPLRDVPERTGPARQPNGMRIRRVRLKSVMKLASVFFVLGYLAIMTSLVVLWNVAQGVGFVDDVEDLVETSLGLDSFDVVGQDLFELAGVSVGLLFAMGLVIAVLLAIVYNAACLLFGGLAVETGPLRRSRKVFSLRHRRFLDVR